MHEFHDPILQEHYLRQCLAHDKKPLAIFMGAGAPMSIKVDCDGNEVPLIPDISEMTKQVCAKLSESEYKSQYEKILANFSSDGNPDPNIESILSHIRTLTEVAGADEVRGLRKDDLIGLDLKICDEINRIVDKRLTEGNTSYHKVADWIRSITRAYAVEIFTTNYDLLMEQALEAIRVPFFDGFVGSRFAFFDPFSIEEDQLPIRWARLWKIHGSINWYSDNKGPVYRSMLAPENNNRRVIYPSHLKYDESRKMPYLAMIDRLRSFIKRPSSLLLTCGYSFQDAHLNDMIIQGLQGNSTAIVFGLLYGELENYPDAIKLADSNSNLSLLAADQAIIGSKCSPWAKRSKEDIEDSIAVHWEDNEVEELCQAYFDLGDFCSLGKFLEDIIGDDRKGEKGL